MLDINFIRENQEVVKQGLYNRGVKFDLDQLLKLDDMRRRLRQELDHLRYQQNQITKELKRSPQSSAHLASLKAKAKKLKNQIKQHQATYNQVFKQWQSLMLQVPNLPQEDVPIGDESAKQVVRSWGKPPKFDFKPKDHLELGKALDWIDVERAAKVSGSRFGYLKKTAVLLEFALIRLAFDHLQKYDFIPVIPPVLIKSKMMQGMGYVDTQEDEQERYYLEKDKLYLVGTAEQSIGPMHAGEILAEKDLPLRYVAFSSCFRREAGSYGKDTRGVFRVHQFDKVEMFSFTLPQASKKEHQLMLQIQEELMQKLALPYRVVQLSTGDLARPSASTFDIETWLPGQNNGQGAYRETHSTSNTTDFQARRLNIRYRPSAKGAKPEFVHMLNGTAFAIGRMLIAILENYQQKDGTIKMPAALKAYLPPSSNLF